nr:MAG TPA: hypothetical protein [Caudoviricetes sp.]
MISFELLYLTRGKFFTDVIYWLLLGYDSSPL